MRVLPALVLATLLAACAPSNPGEIAARDWSDCELQPNPTRQLQACSAIIESGLADASRRTTAFINRASLRSAQHQYARAIADLGRASRLAANDPRIPLERARIHRERGAFNAALRSVDEALRIEPSMPAALRLREELIAGRPARAEDEIARISRALAADPANAPLLNQRCWLRALDGTDLEGALADCNGAIAADPSFAAAFDSRGLVNLKRGALREALADYEAALKIEPGRGHYLYGRGLARIAIGEKEDGLSDLTAAERAEPGVSRLYQSYGVDLIRDPREFSPAPSPSQTSPQ